MRRFRLPLVLFIIVVIPLLLVACGGNEPTQPPVSTQAPPVATDPPPPPPPPTEETGPSPIDTKAFSSGDEVFFTDFDGDDGFPEGWSELVIPSDNEDFEAYLDGFSNFYFDITEPDTDVMAIYDTEMLFFPRDNPDMYVEATVFNVGKNTLNNISVICRYSEEGFYMFSLMSGGKWFIWKYTFGKDWRQLLEGGLQNFDYSTSHTIGGSCIGDELTLYVDGEPVRNGEYTETTFRDGGVGVGVYSGNGGVQVEIQDFTVSIP